jgi:hypothetical protein
MRLIGLAVVLAVSLFAATLATEAQSAEKVHRIGWLSPPSDCRGDRSCRVPARVGKTRQLLHVPQIP